MKKHILTIAFLAVFVGAAAADGYWWTDSTGTYYLPYTSTATTVIPQTRVQETKIYVIRSAATPVTVAARPVVIPRGNLSYPATITAYYAVDGVIPHISRVNYAQCSIFGDGSIRLQIFYTDSAVSDYWITKPVFRARENASLFKTTYNLVEKRGPELLIGPLTCDVYSNGQSIHQITLYGRNRSSITINLSR